MAMDVAFLTIAEASALIKSRQLSPVEYVEALIARTETFDSQLHAYITPTFDLAHQQAQQAAQEITAGWDLATSAPTVIPEVDPGDSCTAAPARGIFLRRMARFFMASVCRWR